jgi:uncharacterized protein YndB with AHSA1/START domain
MKITVETVVKAKLSKVWDVWNNPADIKQWITPHTRSRMEENTRELQRTAWQAILDNFGRHVEAKGLNQVPGARSIS